MGAQGEREREGLIYICVGVLPQGKPMNYSAAMAHSNGFLVPRSEGFDAENYEERESDTFWEQVDTVPF